MVVGVTKHVNDILLVRKVILIGYRVDGMTKLE